uniref:Retrovirus-related Pol polyprotein from transposon TNT 1-94-like beta-barrel domain-containing protein n=1 Tax=Arundo donax TaxID=35708 RepID=A0A0A9G5I2_ARUDO
MASGPELAEEKVKFYGVGNIYWPSMNFDDCSTLKQQFFPGLPSNPLCSKYEFIEFAGEKVKLYDFGKISWPSINFDDCNILKQQFVPGLPSNPLCSKVLVEPYHGIEALNANFSWLVGEHDVNTWVLPIERPLGPGANSSSGFAAAYLWLDSGCTHHVVCDYRLLVNCRAPPAGKNVKTADGSLVPVCAVGTINIPGFYIPEV